MTQHCARLVAVIVCTIGLVVRGPRFGPLIAQIGLAVGDSVPPVLVGKDPDGKPISYQYSHQSSPTVVYVVSPFSQFVVENEGRFAALINKIRGRYRWMILSPNEPRFTEYINKIREQLPAPVVAMTGIGPDVKKQMMLGGYPQTLVISPTARVLANFMGPYQDDSISAQPAALDTFFAIKR